MIFLKETPQKSFKNKLTRVHQKSLLQMILVLLVFVIVIADGRYGAARGRDMSPVDQRSATSYERIVAGQQRWLPRSKNRLSCNETTKLKRVNRCP